MAVLPIDDDGLEAAVFRLRADQAIVLPFPSPLPYAAVAAVPGAVNRLKGRPENQPLGVLVSPDDTEWAADIDLPPLTLARVIRIGVQHNVNMMLPLRAPATYAAGRWTVTAAHSGMLAVTFAVRPDLHHLLDKFGHLYVSSANVTGAEPAVSARQAAAQFGEHTLVLDGDSERDFTRPHGSATILRVAPDGALDVLRRGVHDQTFTDSNAYLQHLAR